MPIPIEGPRKESQTLAHYYEVCETVVRFHKVCKQYKDTRLGTKTLYYTVSPVFNTVKMDPIPGVGLTQESNPSGQPGLTQESDPSGQHSG